MRYDRRCGPAAYPLLAALALLGSSTLAAAHHPTGRETPTTLWHGLLSGIGHPILGVDHLAYIVGLAIFAATHQRPVGRHTGQDLAIPLLFLGAMLAGVLLHVGGVALPAVETGVTLSVVLIGFALAAAWRTAPAAALAALAMAGVLHGFALGESVVGAEPTPIMAYLTGLALVQLALTVAVTKAVRATWQFASVHAKDVALRLIGALIALVGIWAGLNAVAT
jgi:urease accessory protein